MTNEKIYGVWHGMKRRCLQPSNKAYKDYGGRGITVCSEWVESFEMFFNHVSKLPHYGEKGYSLDRIDNNGNYEPGNVRWATRTEQMNNTRRNKCYLINDELVCKECLEREHEKNTEDYMES